MSISSKQWWWQEKSERNKVSKCIMFKYRSKNGIDIGYCEGNTCLKYKAKGQPYYCYYSY